MEEARRLGERLFEASMVEEVRDILLSRESSSYVDESDIPMIA